MSDNELDLGHMLRFDYNRGLIMLTEGSTCWNELRTSFIEMADWIAEQLKMAE